jgi:hypothetical protein
MALSAPLAAAAITVAGLTAGFALCGAALIAVALTSAWLLHRLRPEQRAARTGSEPINTPRRTTCCP